MSIAAFAPVRLLANLGKNTGYSESLRPVSSMCAL